jgi:uncharacterized protein YhhL (DUF1145 family)
MSGAKIACLAGYAVLAAAALLASGAVASTALWILIALAGIHLVEVLVFFKLCHSADGSLGGNLLGVFLFGVFHVKEMQAGAAVDANA